jgi:hypothetical protein
VTPVCIWEDITKMGIKDLVCEGVDWIKLTQDRDWWQIPLNTIMNLGFHKAEGGLWPAERWSGSGKRICPTELTP